MADVTTPTNTLAIRQDRMAMLTERDRVTDRLLRLENAARDGLLGGGGGGSAVVNELGWHSTSSGTTPLGPAANVWQRSPLPANYTKIGDTAAFTNNGDGTFTVRDAGLYAIEVVLDWNWTNTGAKRITRLVRGTNETGEYLAMDERNAPGTTEPTLTITAAVSLVAGSTLCVMTQADTASIGRNVLRFNIVRLGAGPAGPAGPQGPAGVGGADANYVHTQGSPSAVWNVAHNLNKFASVMVVDSGGTVVIPDILYVSANSVTLTFGSATSGKAYVN